MGGGDREVRVVSMYCVHVHNCLKTNLIKKNKLWTLKGLGIICPFCIISHSYKHLGGATVERRHDAGLCTFCK